MAITGFPRLDGDRPLDREDPASPRVAERGWRFTRDPRIGASLGADYTFTIFDTKMSLGAQVQGYRLLALGIDPDTARRDAEGIEHHVSAETVNAFALFVQMRQQSVG